MNKKVKRLNILVNKYLQRYYCHVCRGYEYCTDYVDGQFCHKHGGVLYLLRYQPNRKSKPNECFRKPTVKN